MPANITRSEGGKRLPGVTLLVVLAGFVAIGYVLIDRPWERHEEARKRPEGDADFPDEQWVPSKQIEEQVGPLFERLGAALREKDREQLLDHFDVARLLDESLALEVLPRRMSLNRHETLDQIQEALGQGP